MSQETSHLNTENATAAQPEQTKNNPSQAATENQPVKTYTQEDVDNIMAKVKNTTEAKVLKRFEGVDVATYKTLLEKEEQIKLEEQKKKGEFEKILKDQAEKAKSKIDSLTKELSSIKIDGALLNSASKHKAINPEQVVKLVRDQVKMTETGTVEVVDPMSGQARYTDKGELLTPDGLIAEFLNSNAHFVSAGPAGSGSKSNTSTQGAKSVDINKLDLKDPEQFALYKRLRHEVYKPKV
jgi:uncharacterized membrane protein